MTSSRAIGLLTVGLLVMSACGDDGASTSQAATTFAPLTTTQADAATTTLPEPTSTVSTSTTSTPQPTTTTLTTTTTTLAVIDADALLAQHCAVCHGAQLEGGIGPALAGGGHAGDHSAAELAEVIAEGRGQMPAWSDVLTKEEIAALVARIEELQAHE